MSSILIAPAIRLVFTLALIVFLTFLLRRDDETWWASFERAERKEGHTVVRTPDWRQRIQRQRRTFGFIIVLCACLLVWQVYRLWTLIDVQGM